MLSPLRSLLRTRQILRLLIVRDLKLKYANTALGYFWSVLEPLLMAFVYWFVFSLLARGLGEQPYVLFIVLGLLPWYWASGVISEGSRALRRDARLIRSSNLPRVVWVLRVVGSKGAEFILSLPVIALFALYFGMTPSGYLWAWPLAILLQTVFLVGVALILAPLTVLYNDIERLIRVLNRIMFYVSPVLYGVQDIYDVDEIPDWFQRIYVFNPLAGIFDLYRAAFFPKYFAGWHEVGVAAAVSFAFLAVGMVVFSRLEGPVLKEI